MLTEYPNFGEAQPVLRAPPVFSLLLFTPC